MIAYLDPDGDVTTEWTPFPAGTHYTCIDDGVREPNEPDLDDRIISGEDAITDDVFDFPTIAGIAEVTQIKVWQFNMENETGYGTNKVNINMGGWQTEQDAAVGGFDEPDWTSNTFTGNFSQSDLDGLQVKLAAEGGEGEQVHVYALYVEVTYTETEVSDQLLNPLYPIALRVRGHYRPYAIFREMPYGRVTCKMYYPYNPRTVSQQTGRNFFAYAVANWQGFNAATKNYYNALRYPGSMSGYNRYIRLYLLGT